MINLTKIPEDGWDESHLGLEIVLKLPYGTILRDTIVKVPLMFEVKDSSGGVSVIIKDEIIGPSIEVGTILARMGYAAPVIESTKDFDLEGME
tara:strand:+ start:138 stop:416 length:279 start_codon:yes stop_codon:yes gene_type:complete